MRPYFSINGVWVFSSQLVVVMAVLTIALIPSSVSSVKSHWIQANELSCLFVLDAMFCYNYVQPILLNFLIYDEDFILNSQANLMMTKRSQLSTSTVDYTGTKIPLDVSEFLKIVIGL